MPRFVIPITDEQRMRVVLQRAASASVTVEGAVVSSCEGPCLVALVGLGPDDDERDVVWTCDKFLNMKLWPDPSGKPWRMSAEDKGYDVLLVSQFTLYATFKGRRPDFSRALRPDVASALYENMVNHARRERAGRGRVLDGQFGALMQVSLVNDGPVTITLDSRDPSVVLPTIKPRWQPKPASGSGGRAPEQRTAASGTVQPPPLLNVIIREQPARPGAPPPINPVIVSIDINDVQPARLADSHPAGNSDESEPRATAGQPPSPESG